MEKSIVKLVFRTATAMSIITPAQIPYFERVKAKTNRRPAFTKQEIAKLEKIAFERISEVNHPRVKRERQLLYGYIRFMLLSAMRVGEARYLQFCDLEYLEQTNELEHDNLKVIANNNVRSLLLKISVGGKTGKQEIVANEQIRPSIFCLYKLAKDALKTRVAYNEGSNIWESDTYLFGRADGTVTKVFEVGFKELLIAVG